MQMDWISVKRVCRAGFLSFWRNGFVTLASVLVMTVTLFTLGLVVFTGIILGTTLDDLRDKADINVYFTTSAPEERILEFKVQIEGLPEVAGVEYISREQELALFRERHANDQLTLQALDELGDNPLGAVLNIRAKDISQYDAIGKFLENEQALKSGETQIIDKVNYFDERHRTAIDRLASITDAAERLGLVIIIILALIAIAITFNTIRLAIYTSREEIAVMRLVGAGQAYIRAPFMVEGVLYGLVSGIITLLIFYPLTWWLGRTTENFFGGLNVFSYYVSHFPLFFLVIVGTGAILGAVASLLATRRYLQL